MGRDLKLGGQLEGKSNDTCFRVNVVGGEGKQDSEGKGPQSQQQGWAMVHAGPLWVPWLEPQSAGSGGVE